MNKGPRNRRKKARFSDLVRTADKIIDDCLLSSKHVGRLVRYYDNGWYAGYLMSVNKGKTEIQPIGAKNGVKPHLVTVAVKDVELVKEWVQRSEEKQN